MGAWLPVIAGVIQIVLAILKNNFEIDAEERKRKNDLHSEWKEVAASGDIGRINAFLLKLRK